jgi:hypothetical protein
MDIFDALAPPYRLALVIRPILALGDVDVQTC